MSIQTSTASARTTRHTAAGFAASVLAARSVAGSANWRSMFGSGIEDISGSVAGSSANTKFTSTRNSIVSAYRNTCRNFRDFIASPRFALVVPVSTASPAALHT